MTFADRYPDEPVLHGEGDQATGTLEPSSEAVKRRDAMRRAFAEMPRCKCRLLLPCNDCLPTDAASFQDKRMAGGESTYPEQMPYWMNVGKTPKYLREKDAERKIVFGRGYKRKR